MPVTCPNPICGSPSSAVYADSDLDWDGADDWNSGGADGDLFAESFNANTGLSGVGRVSSPAVASRLGGTDFVPPTQPALRFSRCSSHSPLARHASGGWPCSGAGVGVFAEPRRAMPAPRSAGPIKQPHPRGAVH